MLEESSKSSEKEFYTQHYCRNVEVLSAVLLLGSEAMKEIVGGEETSNNVAGESVEGKGSIRLLSTRLDLALQQRSLVE